MAKADTLFDVMIEIQNRTGSHQHTIKDVNKLLAHRVGVIEKENVAIGLSNSGTLKRV